MWDEGWEAIFHTVKKKKSEALTQVTVWINERDVEVTKRRCCLESNIVAGEFGSGVAQIRIHNYVDGL